MRCASASPPTRPEARQRSERPRPGLRLQFRAFCRERCHYGVDAAELSRGRIAQHSLQRPGRHVEAVLGSVNVGFAVLGPVIVDELILVRLLSRVPSGFV